MHPKDIQSSKYAFRDFLIPWILHIKLFIHRTQGAKRGRKPSPPTQKRAKAAEPAVSGASANKIGLFKT